VVLGPADDGGYYLLGMTAEHTRLFGDIAWSTDSVAAATRDRARALGLEVVELPNWYDVDDGESLRRLCLDLADQSPAPGSWQAPATADALRRMGLLQPVLRAAE
jgi:hypothetical protein